MDTAAMTIEASTAISIGLICTIVGVVISYLAFFRNVKKDSEDTGSSKGQMVSDLGYIKAGVDDLKQEQREQRKTNAQMAERMAAVEQSAKSAHHRIDFLEGKHE